MADRPDLGPRPTGTVTFLFSDVEGSTALWEHDAVWMEQAHRRHEALLRAAITAHGGWAYKQIGDGFQAAFPTAPAALAAAVAAQRALHDEWTGDRGQGTDEGSGIRDQGSRDENPNSKLKTQHAKLALKVRMGLHTGTAEERPDDYFGQLLNRAARLMAAGHGGQILLSEATAALVRDSLPAGVALRDLGERRLKDLTRPEHVWQVVAPDLPTDFPPLRTAEAARPAASPVPPVMSILVIDDSATQRLLLTGLLRAAGYPGVVGVTSAQDAFRLLGMDDPAAGPCRVDVIVTDVRMPDIDGVEACRRIKADNRLEAIPVIMVTASADEANLAAAFDAGAHDYIAKPVKKIEFLARVRAAMRLKKEMDRRKAREQELLEVTQQLTVANEQLEEALAAVEGAPVRLPLPPGLEEALGLGAHSPRPLPAGIYLTGRELDVLGLVAQGLTDAQVAEQLVLSPRTVSSHLSTIYSKLGVSSRAAATRFALDYRLV